MLWKTEQEGTGSSEQSVGEAARQNDETLLWILLKDGYSPDDSSGGRSALYWACLQNNMNIVKLLVNTVLEEMEMVAEKITAIFHYILLQRGMTMI